MGEFRETVDRIAVASNPADLFGPLDGSAPTRMRALNRIFLRMARVVHPDTANGDADDAQRAFVRLKELVERAEDQIVAGTYGTSAGALSGVRVGGYALGDRIAQGDAADVYAAVRGDERLAVKLVRQPRNADLLDNEQSALQRLHRAVDDRWALYFPTFVEGVTVRNPATRVNRRANVFQLLDGFVTLAEVVAAYPGGVHPLDMAWMWRRLLTALGAAHQTGTVHGAVLPPHVLIHPAKHGLVLVGWGAARSAGERVRAISSPHRDWYPPEIMERRAAGPAADIFMAAETVIRILGGSGTVPPAGTIRPLRAFFRACTLRDPKMRPDDAWELKDTFDELFERIAGPRRFREFRMPGATPEGGWR